MGGTARVISSTGEDEWMCVFAGELNVSGTQDQRSLVVTFTGSSVMCCNLKFSLKRGSGIPAVGIRTLESTTSRLTQVEVVLKKNENISHGKKTWRHY